jgi:hypothetical protein
MGIAVGWVEICRECGASLRVPLVGKRNGEHKEKCAGRWGCLRGKEISRGGAEITEEIIILSSRLRVRRIFFILSVDVLVFAKKSNVVPEVKTKILPLRALLFPLCLCVKRPLPVLSCTPCVKRSHSVFSFSLTPGPGGPACARGSPPGWQRSLPRRRRGLTCRACP